MIARRVPMTAMPQLVAAFHSLVGLAACWWRPPPLRAGGLRHRPRADIQPQSLIELSLGVAIGAVTFTGSLIAFAKLNGNMTGAPIMLPARHVHQHRARRWRWSSSSSSWSMSGSDAMRASGPSSRLVADRSASP